MASSHDSTTRRDLVVLSIAAAAIRLVWARWPEPLLRGDASEYWPLAKMIATKHFYSYDGLSAASSRPPLYSALVAVCMRLTQHPHAAVIGLQILFGALTVVLTASLASRAFGRRVGLIAGAAMAVAPMSAHFSAVMLTETLFTFLVALSMWLWQSDRPIVSGIAFGLSALTRPTTQPVIVLLALSGIVFRRTSRQRQALTIALAAFLTVLPWIARNAIEVGRPVISDGNWGESLAYGSVALHTGSNRFDQVARTLEFGVSSDTAMGMFVHRVTSNPIGWLHARVTQYPWLLLDTGDYLPTKVVATPFFTALATGSFTPVLVKIVFLASNLVVVLLAMYGFASARGRLSGMLELWFLPAFLFVAELVSWVEPRFALPIEPYIVTFAALGITTLVGRAQRRSSPAIRTPSAGPSDPAGPRATL